MADQPVLARMELLLSNGVLKVVIARRHLRRGLTSMPPFCWCLHSIALKYDHWKFANVAGRAGPFTDVEGLIIHTMFKDEG